MGEETTPESPQEGELQDAQSEEERNLLKREVVKLDDEWLKKQGNPDVNPRSFQVVCTLAGNAEPARKGPHPSPRSIVKDQKMPPPKNIAVDVKELPNAYMFVADVPGLKNTDIKVDVINDCLLVIACGRSRVDEPQGTFIAVERTMGRFVRRFQLPHNADLDAMKASCVDGILSILVPISPPLPEHVPKSFDVPCTTPK